MFCAHVMPCKAISATCDRLGRRSVACRSIGLLLSARLMFDQGSDLACDIWYLPVFRLYFALRRHSVGLLAGTEGVVTASDCFVDTPRDPFLRH
jgi:hypothetical protein